MVYPLSIDDLSTPLGRFAANLRRLRIQAGFERQRDLAGAVGVNAVTISHYEVGKRCPDVPMLFALSETLKVDASELVAGWMLSDRPDDWPIDLEVYPMRSEVLWYAGAIFGAIHKNADISVIQLVETALLKEQPAEASDEVRKQAWSVVSKRLPKDIDPRISRYFKRRLMGT